MASLFMALWRKLRTIKDVSLWIPAILWWCGINIPLFTYKFDDDTTWEGYHYLRHLINLGLPFSRASASVIMVNCILLVLLVCRNLISALKGFPFLTTAAIHVLDSSRKYHRIIAYTICVMSFIHVAGHVSNVAYIVLASVRNDTIKLYLTYRTFHDVGLPVKDSQDAGVHLAQVAQATPFITGILLIVILVAMVWTSRASVRQAKYNMFWYLHKVLFISWFICLGTHATQGVLKYQSNPEQHDPKLCMPTLAHSNNTTFNKNNSTTWNKSNSTTWNKSNSTTWNKSNSTAWNESNSTTWNKSNSTTWNKSNSTTWKKSNSTTWNKSNSTTWNKSNSTIWNQSNSATWNKSNSTTWNISNNTTWNKSNSTTWNKSNSTTWNKSNSTTWNKSNSTTWNKSNSTTWNKSNNTTLNKSNNTTLKERCSVGPEFESIPTNAWKYVVVPLFIYMIESMVRIWRHFQKCTVTKIIKHPSNVLELQMHKEGFTYGLGEYVFLFYSDISVLQWHPFSLTSHPQENYFSVHIRLLGDWTKQLGVICEEGDYDVEKCNLKIACDGPYRSPASNIGRYKTIICIGSNIGITPFVSVLKSFLYQPCEDNGEDKVPKKVYFYWMCRKEEAFDWLRELLQKVEHDLVERGSGDSIEYKIHLTRSMRALSIKRVANKHAERKDDITGLDSKTNFGRPRWPTLFERVSLNHQGSEIGVFACGAQALADTLNDCCRQFTDGKTKFLFHPEQFF